MNAGINVATLSPRSSIMEMPVFALSNDLEAGLFERPNGGQMIDAGDFRQD